MRPFFTVDAKLPSSDDVKLRSLSETSPDAVVTFKHGRNIETVNPAFIAMFGYSREETAGLTLRSLFTNPPQDDESLLQELGREAECLRKDGSVFPAEISWNIFECCGEQVRMIILRDVSERISSRKALEESERKYRALVEDARDAILLAGVDGRVIDANASAGKLFCREKEELLGLSIREMHPAGNADEYSKKFGELWEKGSVHIPRALILKKDGGTAVVDLNASIVEIGGIKCAHAILRDMTQALAAEENLRKSEQHFKLIFDHGSVGKALLDLDGGVLKVNDAFCRMLGYTKEEFLTKKMSGLTHPDDLKSNIMAFDSFVRGNNDVMTLEKRYMGKGGQTVWVLLNVALVRDGYGAPMHLITQAQDITEMKKSQERLRKSERLLAEAQKIAGLGYWEWDVDCDHLIWSDETYRIFGLLPLQFEATYEAFISYVHPEDREIVLKAVGEALSHGAEYDTDHRIVTPDGSVRMVHERGEVYRDATGAPARMMGTIQDITESKKAEEKLRQSEEKFRTLFNGGNDAVTVTLLNGAGMPLRFVDVNDKAVELYGYSREEFMELSPISVTVDPEYKARLKDILAEINSRGRAVFEWRSQGKGGKVLELEISSQKIKMLDSDYYISIIRDISERKRAEAKLKASESRYRALFENESDAIVVVDAQTRRYEDVNPAAMKMYGYTREEMLSMGPVDLSAEPESTLDAFRRIADNNVASHRVTMRRMKRKDGTVFPVELCVGVFEEGGKVKHVTALRDISIRVEAEKAIRQSEERYKQLADNSPDIIYSFSDKRGGVYYSASAEKILGYPLGYMYEHPFLWNQSIHPDDLPLVALAVKELTLGLHFDVEYRVKNCNGKWLWFRDRSIGMRANGDETIINGMATDLTVQKAQEEAIRCSEDKYKAIFNNGLDAVFVVSRDVDGVTASNFLDANDVVVKMLGYSRDELLTMTPDSLIPDNPELKAKLPEVGAKIMKDGRAIFDWALKAKDGRIIPVEISSHRLLLQGRATVISMLRDISDREKRRELEIAARSLELTNRELQEFAYVASHDLQEPLRTIIAFSDRLEGKFAGELSPKAADYLRRIRVAGKRMSQLIHDLLHYSRVTGSQLDFERVDLNQVLEALLEDMRGRIEQSRAHVTLGPMPVVRADNSQMRQMFQNLVSNAMKYHKPGERPVIKIYGKKARAGEGGAVWDVVVEDEGIGFDAKYADKIFNIFERLHGYSEYEGTGVGLATVRKIVERHAWTVSADGYPDVGAKFTIRLKSVEA
ncbi:MAG: PAS domain S-box protein [Nitrospinae bacterium]|nr:PAS domain S-box protein [Nitrospinota bacterium]